MITRILFPALVLLACSAAHAQIAPANDWSDLMHDRYLPFDSILSKHQAAWPHRPTERGQGFKQVERFKWLHSPRLNADGHILTGREVLESWRQVQNYSASRSLSGNWYNLGPIIDDITTHDMIEGVGRMNTIAFHPSDPNILFAGSPAGGLWRSFDGGATWSSNTDQLPTLGISSIAFDPTNPDIIYAGTGDRDAADAPGLGVIKSTDGGETWTFVNTGIEDLTVGVMRFQPETGHLFIGTTDGIHKTMDGGATWEQVSENTSHYKDLEFRPGDPNIIYATASGKFYRSIDGGVEWDVVNEVIQTNVRMCIAVTPLNPDLVYVIKTGTYAFAGFYRSLDSGATFEEMSTTPNIMGWAADGSSTGGQAWYDLCLEADHENPDVVYVGGIRMKKSTDAGVTWQDINPNYLHVDQHELVMNPHNLDVYVCNDGGLYEYVNNEEWKDISYGIVTGQIYQLGQSPHNPYHTLTGYQDNGTMEFDGVYWKRKGGGDGFECAYDFTDQNWRYGSIYYGDIYRTTPVVVNQKICGIDVLGIDEEGAWNTPYALATGDSTANTLFAGLKNVWRTFNIKHPEKDSIVWQKISNNLGSNSLNIDEIEICVSNPQILYVAKENRKLYRSNNALDANPTWTNISFELPVFQVPVKSIETNPIDSNIVYICFNNNVYRSANQGADWTLISPNFPDIQTNTIVLDKTDPGLEALYVGTDMGVYYKDSSMVDFIPFNTGMPLAARVTELEIYYGEIPAQHRIKASTYGRGLWESDLYSAQTNNFPAVAAVTKTDSGNEAFGPFEVSILFYKNLDEAEMSGFDDVVNDFWIENGSISDLQGGPAIYTATVTPQTFGTVRLFIPDSVATDNFSIPNYQSDTLEIIYTAAPELLGNAGPGGVGDAESMTIWLRADHNVVMIDDRVQSWNDLIGNGYEADQLYLDEMPALATGEAGINGRPAISFDGENDMLQIGNMVPGRSISAFVMVETDTIKFNEHGWFASSRMPNGYLMHPWKNDWDYHNEVIDAAGAYSGINSFYIADASAPHIYGFVYHQDDLHQIMNTYFDDELHAQPGVNIGPRSDAMPITVDIGHDSGYENERYGKGRIAEHFVYSTRLMDSHLSIIKNYMASAYGIDLGPQRKYHHPEQSIDMIGIGRENEYDLHTDAQGLGILRVFNASSLDDGDYLMIGTDNAPLEMVDNQYPFLSERTARTWGFNETGDVGTVTIRIEMDALPVTSNIGIILTEGDEFQPGSTLQFYPLFIQGPVLEATIDFPANGVFTIGYEPFIGVDDMFQADAVIYPNPASDHLQVRLEDARPSVWYIDLYDATGRLVLSQLCSGKQSTVVLETLPAGYYIAEVRDEKKVISRKNLIIENSGE